MICKKIGILKLRSKQGPKQTLFSSEAIGQIRIVQNSSHAAWEKHLKSNQLTLGHSLNPRPVRISFPATANHVSRAAERRTRPPVQGGDSTRHSLRWVWFGLVWHASLLPCSSWKHAFCAVAAAPDSATTGDCSLTATPESLTVPRWSASIPSGLAGAPLQSELLCSKQPKRMDPSSRKESCCYQVDFIFVKNACNLCKI